MKSFLDVACKVIETEINGMQLLKNSLGEEFAEACTIICNAKGRVIVTGIGKSGHIGKKVASTLASLGTSSFFVHPAEAVHGDLGMIDGNDVILAISNSGNTGELKGIISYATRFSIPIIAITSGKDSELAKFASVVLLLPKAKEACSLGLAPTTSTTMTVVLGDALAVALLEHNGFSAEDFNVYHPGGSLGARLIKCSDLMHGGSELPLVDSGASILEAIAVISAKALGCCVVQDSDKKTIGIITDGDIRRLAFSSKVDFYNTKARDVAQRNYKYIESNKLASQALAIMEQNKNTNLVVKDQDNIVGIIHIHDCLRARIV